VWAVAVVLKGGSFEVTKKMGTVVIPNTINDVLMARIDRLEEKTRNLLKVASVIGRNFFYRILTEAARIEDIDNRLSHLKEIQLIQERRRMKELEYLFKHALAQEATYESILPKKRKDLHLRVADSIENVFNERLHKFYGMLAFHYGKAEAKEKTEEYLIKAGDEALRVSASNEALYYYREALDLYLKQHKDAADPEKVSSFERGIAIALYNKGQYSSAMEYFDSVFKSWGVPCPKNKVSVVISLIYNIIFTMLHFYFPSKKERKIPSKRDHDIFDLSEKRVVALEYLDSLRFVWEVFRGVRRAFQFDLSKLVNGHGAFIGLTFVFSATGLSFKIGKKSLEYSKSLINTENYGHLIQFYGLDTIHHLCEGSWDQIIDYDEKLIVQSCKRGCIEDATGAVWANATVKIEQGRFNEAKNWIIRMNQIREDYENLSAKIAQDNLEAYLALKSRTLVECLTKMDEAIDFAALSGFLPHQIILLGIKARIQISSKNMNGAKESLFQAGNIVQNQQYLLNWYIADYLMAQFEFNTQCLEEKVHSNDKDKISKYQKKAHRSGVAAKKIFVRRYAVGRIEYYKIMSQFYWLIGKQKKATMCWSKSIEEGEHLGARPELSRTYMEVGKRLLEPKSRSKEFNGIKAEEYLKKAKTMFEEMDLQWDLDELDRISAYR